MEYAQSTMEEALRRIKLMRANLGGTEILIPLQHIYKQPSVPGHPLQVRIGTELKKGWNGTLIEESIALGFITGLLKCGSNLAVGFPGEVV